MLFNEGMEVVKKIEALGSDSGETAEKVMIMDSGVLPPDGASDFL